MKISFSHIRADLQKSVEKVVGHHLEKLERLLKRYAPDLVQLHGGLEQRPRKADFAFSLNLALPTGTLHATGIAQEAPASARVAFAELESQLKKHKAKLRKDYEWKRKRPRPSPPPDTASAAD
ncbi:MAG: HPF/RaiA family ribosome-associated protein [Candidatus Acidiferrales bacterium]